MRKAGLVAAILGLCVISQAGVILDSFLCTFDDDPTGENHSWSYDYANDVLTLIETYDHPGVDTVNVSGLTDTDPDLTMTKAVLNDNGSDWTAYTLTLGPFDGLPLNATFVSGSSDLLPIANVTPTQITFSGGTVLIGETLNMSFVVNVPTVGDFGFGLHQLAIPEPATMALLGLGSLLAIRRRK